MPNSFCGAAHSEHVELCPQTWRNAGARRPGKNRVLILALALSACSGAKISSTAAVSSCPGPAPVRTPGTVAHQLLQSSHHEPVTHLAFSSQQYLATGSDDGEVRIWDTRTMTQLAVLQAGGINDLQWNARGDRLVVLGRFAGRGFTRNRLMGRAREYDVAGLHTRTWPIPLDSMRALAGSGDRWVARAADTALVVDLETCASVQHEVGCYGPYCNSSLDAGGDGALFASRNSEGWVIFRVGQLEPIATSAADELTLLSKDRYVARTGKRVSIHRVPGGEVITTFASEVDDDAKLQVDGSSLVTWSARGIVVLDLGSGKQLWTRRFDDKGVATLASSDGKLAIAMRDRRVILHDLRSGRVRGELGPGRARMPVAVPLIVGSQLYIRSANAVSIWSLETGRRLFSIPTEGSLDLVTRPNGRVDVALREDGDASDHDSARLRVRLRPVVMPATSADGGAVEVVDEPLALRPDVTNVYDLHPYAPRGLVEIADEPVALVAGGASGMTVGDPGQRAHFSATGRYAVTSNQTSGLVVVESDTGTEVSQIPLVDARTPIPSSAKAPELLVCPKLPDDNHDTVITKISGITHHEFSADDRWLAVEFEGRFRIHEMASGKVVSGAVAERITAIALAGTTPKLLLGSADGELLVWSDGRVIARAENTGGQILRIAVDSAGQRFTTVSGDGATRIWDLATLQVLVAFAEYEDDEWVTFTPNGAYTGTAEVAERVTWRFDAPVEAFRFEQFEREFRREDVISRRLSSGGADITAQPARPPRIELVAHSVAKRTGHVTVTARVSSSGRVDSVSGFREGRAVARERVCRPARDVTLEVPLLAGTNRVQVTAFDERGAASNPLSIDVATPTVTTRRPELWVVAVGVSEYPRLERIHWLGYADDDARGIAAAFARHAGPNAAFAAIRSQVLVDREVTQASVKRALGELRHMKPDDLAIIFLAGHGIARRGDGAMVFLTADSDADAREGAIAWAELSATIDALPCRTLVLLDACHSGHINQDVVVPNAALASMLEQNGRAGAVVFAAAKGRQLSYEPNGSRGLQRRQGSANGPPVAGDHGFFTGAVIDVLGDRTVDPDGDGVLQLSELVEEVTRRVSSRTGGLQTPWVARREHFGDYGLARVRP